MTDSECDEVFGKLQGFLNSRNLSWVVEAVLAEIAEGSEPPLMSGIIEKRINPDNTVSETTRSSPVETETFVEFTASQRLRCLINAIEAVVVETTFMQRDTLNTLIPVSEQVGQEVADQRMMVQFTSPTSGMAVHEIRRTRLEDCLKNATTLQRLLNSLREEI